jgi:hypothetical protein
MYADSRVASASNLMNNQAKGAVSTMNLKILLIAHAIITFAAGVVLFVAPAAIPGAVDVTINPDQYLICYLLGAAELAIAFLSLAARKLTDPQAIRIIVWMLIIFHATTGIAETYAFARGTSTGILANVALRVIVVALFAHYGLHRISTRAGVMLHD